MHAIRYLALLLFFAHSCPAWCALPDDLVAYYRFEDNFADTSGSPQVNNGTPVNFPGFTSGKLGKAMALTGFRDYMSLNPATHTELDFGSTTDGTAVDFSISMWIKQTNSASDPAVLSNKDWDSGNSTGINWSVNGSSSPFDLNTKGSTGSRQDLDSASNSSFLAVNSWNLVTMTVDRNGPTKLFINGTNVGTIALSSQGDFNSGLPWNIGQDGVGNYGIDFTGAVDELGFWRRALSPQEVSQLWNNGAGADPFVPQYDTTLKLVVDRQSGQIEIVNNTATDQNIVGYSIVSKDGTLNTTNWNTIRNHYDSHGDGSVDDQRWIVFTKPGSTGDLSEGSLGVGTIDQSAHVDLGEGVWDFYYKESSDLTFEYLNESGQALQGAVEFVNEPSGGYLFGDLDFDGSLDRTDWLVLRDQFTEPLTGLSVAQKYRKSDLNGDGIHNLQDISLFRSAYETTHGPGSFVALLNQIPEPNSSILLLLMVSGLLNAPTRRRAWRVICLCACLLGLPSSSLTAATFFTENFDGIALGPNVDESLAGTQVWSATPPLGWLIDNSALPIGGVTEWAGWSFADPAWWSQAAGDQGRTQFTKASGVVAVADPDEWDDLAHDAGTYNTFLKTPSISLAGTVPNTVQLRFDSSWLPEDFQTANLTVSYGGGPATEIMRWSSESTSQDFKSAATNETVIVPLNNPAGATNMVLEFGMLDAGNDWWWAIDNVQVFTPLTLNVNVDTGEASIISDPGLEISGYEILSPQGSLNANGWLAGNLDHQDYDVPQLVGDFNIDGAVNNLDLAVWKNAYGQTAGADADGDGDSDGRDFLAWQRNFGSQTAAGEPWLTFLATNNQLIEATLGSSEFATTTSLGLPYNTIKDARDLTFRYITSTGEELDGVVLYTGGLNALTIPEPSLLKLLGGIVAPLLCSRKRAPLRSSLRRTTLTF